MGVLWRKVAPVEIQVVISSMRRINNELLNSWDEVDDPRVLCQYNKGLWLHVGAIVLPCLLD